MLLPIVGGLLIYSYLRRDRRLPRSPNHPRPSRTPSSRYSECDLGSRGHFSARTGRPVKSGNLSRRGLDTGHWIQGGLQDVMERIDLLYQVRPLIRGGTIRQHGAARRANWRG
jgi:hypothetical protein